MKKRSFPLLLAVFLFASVIPGCVFANVQRPLDTNFEETRLGEKIGESHMTTVLWLFHWGDAGTKAAAEEGNISTIHHADMKVFTILFGLYGRVTTIVYGD